MGVVMLQIIKTKSNLMTKVVDFRAVDNLKNDSYFCFAQGLFLICATATLIMLTADRLKKRLFVCFCH